MSLDDTAVAHGVSVGILETGVPPASLVARHGRYDAMVRRMLGPGFSTRRYDVQAGDWPAEPGDHAAFVITGSSAGVYEPHPWIGRLLDFIRDAHGRTKLVGLCFGHQAMARALGGHVEKSGKGWGLGLHRYTVRARRSWMTPASPEIAVAASHQDQVTVAPPGAVVLAASAFTPFAALAYAGGPSISVQFHPEFQHDFAGALVELRRPAIDAALADEAASSLAAPGDAARVGTWIKQFLDGA